MPREILSNPEYVSDKRVNALGLAAKKGHAARRSGFQFEKNPVIDKISDVDAVGTVVRFVEQLAAQG